MNLNRLPCANTHYLSRYMAEQERESAYDDEFERRKLAIVAKGISADDAYELGESLQAKGRTLNEEIAAWIQLGRTGQQIWDGLILPELQAILEHRATTEAVNSFDNDMESDDE